LSRAFDKIEKDVRSAISRKDAPAILTLSEELEAAASPEAIALALYARSQAANLAGGSDRGLDLAQQALQAYTDLGDEKNVATCLQNLAHIYSERGEYQDSLEHYQMAIAKFHQLGDKASEAASIRTLGTVHFGLGDQPTALLQFNRALAMFEELGDEHGVARVTGNIGIIYATTGDYPAALEMLHKAIQISEEIKDRYTIAIYSGNIGNVLSAAGSYNEALDYYQRSLKLSEEFGDEKGVAYATGNVGEAYRQKGDKEHALEYLLRALDMHKALGDIPRIALTIANICMTMIDLSMFAEARGLLTELNSLPIDDPAIRVDRHTIEARLEYHAGDLETTHHCYSSALREAEQHNLRSHAADLHKALRDLALRRDDFAGYVEHNDAWLELTEQIKGREATLKIGILEKEREIQAERREKELHQAALYATLPQHVADRVVRGEVVTDHYEHAAVLFLDIVNFTAISDRIPPAHVIHLLDVVFNQCDLVMEAHDMMKIKTIGDSYMAAAFPHPSETKHEITLRAARAARDLMKALDELEITMPDGVGDLAWLEEINRVDVRIGMHVGPVVAGIIGSKRLQYDVWGDTVNVASRMESTSEPTKVQVTDAFAEAIGDDHPDFSLTERGSIHVKGKGTMKTYWLTS